ncbi:MAG: hypothetical protein JWR02_1854 [Mucilaginibacter sp.]|nr:hypothetical protein [Mucilaginibacter sp.]
MATQKTLETNNSVAEFLNTVSDVQKREDCFALVELFTKIIGYEAKMWGTSIVGFGSYHYRYDSGHEGDSCIVGLSPRKQNITMYLMGGFHTNPQLLQQLGKYKTGKGCLYINSLDTVDINVLEQIIRDSARILLERVEQQKAK